MLKKMKVGTRILFGFLIAIILTVALGLVSIFGFNTMSGELNGLYNQPYAAAEQMAVIETNVEKVTRDLYQMTLSTSQEQIDETKDKVQQRNDEIVTAAAELKKIYPSYSDSIGEFEAIIASGTPILEKVMGSVTAGTDDTAVVGPMLENEFTPLLDQALEKITTMKENAQAEADKFMADAETTSRNQFILIIALLAAEIIVAMVLAVKITRSVRKPVSECVDATTQIAQGNLEISVAYEAPDELGMLAGNVRSMVGTLKNYIGEISNVLHEISNGNLDVESKENYMGNFQLIGSSMDKIISSLNSTFESMDQSAGQVAIGSNEVSRGAQALAQGATEQSSSVQELSASIAQVNDQIQQNAESVKQTKDLIGTTAGLVETCNGHMSDMLESMNDINQSSQEISKIIKVIDDISFQTNILALNAAVEAARAGTAGQGFAVVADEVRNLATKSAEAAKETSALIEGSLQKVEIGNNKAVETANVLKSVVENAEKINVLIGEIGVSSDAQARSVAEINQGVEQISMVVQTNSATAEESAAASEELSGQADMMKQLVGRFQLKSRDESTINMDYDPESGIGGADQFELGGDKY
ncbi:methyl-accepting chemotaxis protein [Christensenella intestinihominis]|uniref:methyl-accepting chemotaxis protein n=1 Tax=Christensenella intestinihominis TaxID=1851429 RepID=UPI000835F38E|nr:methyl-accepting chemotaxis protein [Christensenella intestinihominis]